MKRSVIFPNLVTAFSLSCGLFVIFKMLLLPVGNVSYEQVLAAVLVLILAAFLDLLDGAIARAMKVESEFGRVFDSLADAVSFGVAPSVVVLKALSVEPRTVMYFFLTTGAMMYSISGVLRLVRYTVSAHKKTDEEPANKSNFTGLPIPASAVLAISTTLFLMTPEAQSIYPFGLTERVWIATTVFFILGYFMISRWKFPSLKGLQNHLSFFHIVLITAFVASIVLFVAFQHFALLLALVSWSYLIIAWLLSLFRVIAGRKLKALDGFEPEEDSDDEL